MAFKEIDFPEIDIHARAFSRMLLQFRESEVFMLILEAFITELETLIIATQDVMKKRTCYTATASQLDVLGRIVGQTRELIDYDTIVWFTPDTFYASVDQAPAWVVNAPVSGEFIADDSWFRQLIEGKIIRNHIQYGSIPEIQAMVKQSLGIDISIVRTTDLLTVVIVVPDDTSVNDILLLERNGDTTYADKVHFLPIPATVQIAQVVRFSDYTP